MKVSELITRLQELNTPDAEVELEGDEDGDYNHFSLEHIGDRVVLTPQEIVTMWTIDGRTIEMTAREFYKAQHSHRE